MPIIIIAKYLRKLADAANADVTTIVHFCSLCAWKWMCTGFDMCYVLACMCFGSLCEYVWKRVRILHFKLCA